ncbi:zinc-dependent alcohol dehydrogenase [Burkholderia gladioli]|uniref:zinc-dependent alcohol dehydrogenase n=1 Tax=Burkholderia gladioli TaxID=28095 RepID=UPI000F813DAC|nr:zinc-binding alcohol dehydrogenase [Burkholderia gladioli]MBU9641146.1 zinc-binding alcohol dehydrogenase [Burkholderia gladioli]MDN7807376.1 zinc-binding alcohol dehydrogenase [Burkholderia gladioli]
MKTKSIVWTAPCTVELQDIQLGQPGPGEVLIENVISTVSPGTEAEWISSDESHRVLETTFPFVPGYSRAGYVVALGPCVSGLQPGDRVVAGFDNLGRPIGAHAAYSLARASDIDVIPDNVSFEQAALFILGQTAAMMVKLTSAGLSDPIGIVGQGPIGNLAVQFAKASGASPIVALDLVKSRRDSAILAGATEALDPTDEAHFGAFIKRTGGLSKVIDLSGNPAGTNTALHLAGPRATVVFSTGYGGSMTLDYGAIFSKGLHVIGGFVNAIPELARQSTRTYLRLVGEGTINASYLLDTPFSPEEAPDVYRRILARDPKLKVPLFRWRES